MQLDLTPDQLFFLLRIAVVGILIVVGLFHFVLPLQKHLYAREGAKRKDLEKLANGEGSTKGSLAEEDISHIDAEVIIVGSGVLGSAVAATLARDGRKVLVLERDLSEPDRIVGELLQPGGCRALDKLGLTQCSEGIDSRIVMGYVIHDINKGTAVHVNYPESCGGGRAFHHGRFVGALRKAAMAEKNVRYIEGTVTRLLEDGSMVIGVEYREKDSEEVKTLHAPLTIVADGCFSRLRKTLVSERPTTTSHYVGLLMHDCPQASAEQAELVLTNAGPVLVYQVSSHYTRVLVDIRGPLPSDLKSYLAEKVHPVLPSHLKEPFMDSLTNEKIRSMPNSFLPPAVLTRPGVLCLGDALNMRHALTGGGMSVALNDAHLLRELLSNIPDLRDVQLVSRAGRTLYSRRKRYHSFVVNVLAMALYELFAADEKDEGLKNMKSACFEYFRIGGACISGPVDLLSVLRPQPLLLVGHFFAVALYAMYITIKSRPLLYVHKSLWQAVCILHRASGVIFPLIWSELKTLSV